MLQGLVLQGLVLQGLVLQGLVLLELVLRRWMPPRLARLPEHRPAPGGTAPVGRTRTPVRRAAQPGWPGRANRRGWPPDLPV
jgi:hypothetical protein